MNKWRSQIIITVELLDCNIPSMSRIDHYNILEFQLTRLENLKRIT
jgi:hypothetical protein